MSDPAIPSAEQVSASLTQQVTAQVMHTHAIIGDELRALLRRLEQTGVLAAAVAPLHAEIDRLRAELRDTQVLLRDAQRLVPRGPAVLTYVGENRYFVPARPQDRTPLEGRKA